MLKPIRDWTVKYLEQTELSEYSNVEFKASEVTKDITKIGDVVSAFANYDGEHIVLGVRDKHAIKVEADGQLDLLYKDGLRSWLEDIVPTLSDPGVRDLDVRRFEIATGSVAVIEIRESDDAPHQDEKTRRYYGRTGSKCD
jgi:predicted HTH transcriptional regulator